MEADLDICVIDPRKTEEFTVRIPIPTKVLFDNSCVTITMKDKAIPDVILCEGKVDNIDVKHCAASNDLIYRHLNTLMNKLEFQLNHRAYGNIVLGLLTPP
mgnify:CR=1 FL=1